MRSVGRGRKTWRECVKDDMKVLGLHAEWAVFKEEVDIFKINDDDNEKMITSENMCDI